MGRIIFFLYYRAGSTLFECVCGKPWRLAQAEGKTEEATKLHREWRTSHNPFYLPSIPPCISEDTSLSFTEAFNLYKGEPQYVYMMHIGDWWGQKRSIDIPGPFDDPTSQKWGPDELALLPELDSWRFIYLVRDGRCQIESLRNMKGGIEEKLNRVDPEDYFRVLCKGFRNRARLLLKTKECFPEHAHIFHYLDLIKDPVGIAEQMFKIGGLVLDRKKVPILPQGHIHSSFSQVSIEDNHYQSWTQEEISIFDQIAGPENRELGYQ